MNRGTVTRIGHLLAITLIVALVLLTVGLTPAAAQGTRPVACVTAYRLNVRSGPGLTYPVISGLSLDQCVTLAGYRNAEATWVQVQVATGGTGWVSAYYISTAYPITNLAVAPGPSPPAPAPPPATAWRGEYYSNGGLLGTPALVRNDPTINFYWDLGAPAPGLPSDNFSVRWTRTDQFEGVTYRFHAVVDDGVRLWIDGKLLLDAWHDGPAREFVADYALSHGVHSLRVEYYEHAGFSQVRVWWERLWPTTSYPEWKGEYFSNSSLIGTPALVRNDPAIQFNWGLSAAAGGLPADFFSARWTRTADFDGSTYRFHAVVDDGVRVWVDDQRIIDAWWDGAAREYVADYAPSSGSHTVRVEYYEHAGFSEVRAWWEKITPSFPDWKGEYFSNRKLQGSPTLVRNDKKIDFNWKDGIPASGLPKDNFSVRWSRTVEFAPGTYRFYAQADDGIRVYIDDERVLNEWRDSDGSKEHQFDRTLEGKHTLRVEYYERGVRAHVKFRWEQR
jgi:uncharacterized protein YraI